MPGSRNWTHAARIAWPILVDVGSRREAITYEQLSGPLDTNPLSVGKALGVIQTYCLENRLAPLTVVVVGKTSGIPGDGFVAWDVGDFEAARDAVAAQNWTLVGNPFTGFDVDEDEDTLAKLIIDDQASAGDVYRKVRDRGIAQRIFRRALLTAYGSCAMCGLTFESALEAAHIVPWKDCGDDEKLAVCNGLLLCASHHKLFDCHEIRIRPNLTIQYYDPNELEGPYSRTDSKFATKLHGKTLNIPGDASLRPDPALIERRRRFAKLKRAI